MCGGVFDVLVQPLRVGERALAQDVGQDGPIAMAARVPSAGSEPTAGAIAIWKESLEESDGALGRALEQIVPSSVLEFAVQRVAAMIGSGRTGRLRLGPPTSGHEPIDLFIETRTMICVLTHDPKVDVPALVAALDLDLAYVGAMGSRRSDRDRRIALREAGVSEAALTRLHSPIGLGLSALTPAEVAISILAEMLAVQSGRSQVVPLSRGSTSPHRSVH